MLLFLQESEKENSLTDGGSLRTISCFSVREMGTRPYFQAHRLRKDDMESQTMTSTNFPQLSMSVNIKQAFAAGVLECVGCLKYA